MKDFMADKTVASPTPPKRRRWLRVIAWIVCVLIVLLVVVYFVATSSAFFKGVILPKASAAMNANITVSDASISPFSQVLLRDLKVQTTGTEPLVSASEVRLRYSLMDIIRGNLHVDEVTLASPTVTLVENPDKTSNLDPILKAQQPKPQAPKPAPSKPSKPPQLDIVKVALTDGTVRQVKLYPGGNRDVSEISHLTVILDNVKNGQTGKLTLAANIGVDQNPPAPGAKGALQAKLNGAFNLSPSADLKAAAVQGNTRLEVTQATGTLAQAGGFAASFDCDVTPTEVKQLALRLQKGATELGQLLVSGPLNQATAEGRLTIALVNVNKNLLNLAGSSSGLDFGPTTINSSNEVQLAKSGTQVTAAGQLNLDHLQVTRTNQTTPSLDFHANYKVTVDSAAKNAVLDTLTLNGMENGKQFLQSGLSSPMTISWGNTANAVGDSTLNVAVTHLNLADWKPFLGDVAPAGDVNGKLQLVSQQAGKQLALTLSSEIDNLTAGSGSNQITEVTVTFDLRGQVANLKQFNFPEYKFQVARQNQPLLTTSGALTYDQTSQNADVQLNGHLLLARLLQAMPHQGMDLSSGTADFKLHAQYAPQAASAIKAELQVTNLVVNDPQGRIPAAPLQARMQVDTTLNKQVADIRQFQIALTPTPRATNQVQLTGHFDMSDTNALQGNLKLVADSLDFTAYYDLFAGQKKAAETPPAAKPAPAPAAPAPPAGPETEPPAKPLPIRSFVAEAAIGRLYLHNVDITNFQSLTKIEGGHVVLNPCKLTLNNAPVSTTVDADLGVPGYKYAFSFTAQAVPLAPLVDSFQPDRKGQLSGTFSALTQIQGAGVTGTNLQKNLAGQFDINSTNLNLAVGNIKNPLLKALVSAISAIPDLAKSPASTISSLLQSPTASSASSGGPAPDLQQSPVDAIILRGNIGSGKVQLQQATVRSPAFQADATGTVTLAPVISNSVVNIPVTVALNRSVAQRLNLVPANTPTNATYAQLPSFLTMTGTVGKPNSQVDKAVLLKLAAQGVLSSGAAGKNTGLLQDFLGGGSNSPGTNQSGGKLGGFLHGLTGGTSTNQPGSNQSPAGSLLNQFFKPKK
jgi:hypothetical protein